MLPHPFVLHKFRPSETIDAVMRLKGRHNYTQDELRVLRAAFNDLNGAVVPRAGETFKIPLMVPVEVPVVLDPRDDRKEPPKDKEPGDEGKPVDKFPAEPVRKADPDDRAQQNGNQKVAPDPGKDPGDRVNQPAVQATLSVGGSRRR